MAVMVCEAVHDERGKYSGGKAGDQTGDEVRIRSWYSRPWSCVLRWKDRGDASRFADAMRAAANNPRLGYNQFRRNTALTYARQVGYNPAKITKDCETDCSALVSLCCMYAGIPEATLFKNGNSSTTANLRARLKGTGKFVVYSGKEYTNNPAKLMLGDILLYEGHHTAGVITVDASTVNQNAAKKSIEAIAKEVLAGKWANGAERKARLIEAGYDYEAVQKAVNGLVKS